MIQITIQANDVGGLLAQLLSMTTALAGPVAVTPTPVGEMNVAALGKTTSTASTAPTPAATEPAPATGKGKGKGKNTEPKADAAGKQFMLFDPVANTMAPYKSVADYQAALTKKVTSMTVVDDIDAFAAANEATLSAMTDDERRPCDEAIENHLASLGVKPEVDGGDGLDDPAPVPEKIDPNMVKSTLREVVQAKGEAVAAALLKQVGASTWKEVKEDKLGDLYHSALAALGKAPTPAASASLFD